MKTVLFLAVVVLVAVPQMGCRGFFRGQQETVMPVYSYPMAPSVAPGPAVCDPCASVGTFMGP